MSLLAPAPPAAPERLSRRALAAIPGAARPPIRIVHLGLGGFHRSHEAWYTARATDAEGWGIASFTGRSPRAAEPLAEQDGLYTLIERGGDGDRAAIVPSIARACDGGDPHAFLPPLVASETAIVSLTITEPGYRLDATGAPDLDDPVVREDLQTLRARIRGGVIDRLPQSALGRLLFGLQERRSGGGAPLAIVPCDNIPANGALVAGTLTALAEEADAGLARWIAGAVSFVSTSVDRITPRTTESDLAVAEGLTGYRDLAPVVAEPFSDWVLCGDFPAGRPDWEAAGARLVTDIEPYERRKLWLLNGAHSLLAYRGTLNGHRTVAEAIADPECLAAVHTLWAEDARWLPAGLGVDEYCAALLERFSNPRIEHRLAQIGMEGVAKLPVRITPVARRERSAGRDAAGCVEALAAWSALALAGDLPTDASGDAVAEAARGGLEKGPRALLGLLDADLAADEGLVAALHERTATLLRSR